MLLEAARLEPYCHRREHLAGCQPCLVRLAEARCQLHTSGESSFAVSVIVYIMCVTTQAWAKLVGP